MATSMVWWRRCAVQRRGGLLPIYREGHGGKGRCGRKVIPAAVESWWGIGIMGFLW